MTVEIKKSTLASLDDAQLIWACIEPTIRQIRGKSFKVKSEASAELNEAQKALLMYQMLYGHSSGGVLQLLGHLSYLLLEKGVWAELKKGIQYFGDIELLSLLERIEKLYYSLYSGHEDDSGLEGIPKCDEGSDLHPSILDKQLFELIPRSVRLVGSYIRSHINEFAILIE